MIDLLLALVGIALVYYLVLLRRIAREQDKSRAFIIKLVRNKHVERFR